MSAIIAFSELYHLDPEKYTRLEMAKICQRSENEFGALVHIAHRLAV